jgi:hypothetical protein
MNLPAQYEVTRARVVREGDHWLRLGDRAVLDITSAEEAVGKTVEIHLTAEGADAGFAETSRTVVVVDEE